jgi:hypothetical protein
MEEARPENGKFFIMGNGGENDSEAGNFMAKHVPIILLKNDHIFKQYLFLLISYFFKNNKGEFGNYKKCNGNPFHMA